MANANSNVATLRGRADSSRRIDAIAHATYEMDAVFEMLLACIRQLRDEEPKWDFVTVDKDLLPRVIRALAIRGASLNTGVMNAVTDSDATEVVNLERLVSHG